MFYQVKSRENSDTPQMRKQSLPQGVVTTEQPDSGSEFLSLPSVYRIPMQPIRGRNIFMKLLYGPPFRRVPESRNHEVDGGRNEYTGDRTLNLCPAPAPNAKEADSSPGEAPDPALQPD